MKQEQTDSFPLQGAEGADIITSIVINGDISQLSPLQKVNYYKQFCDKLGLNPLSQPFRILRLHGREILYCDRGGAQQLNKLHKLSHKIKSRETVNGCYVVTAQASAPDGRKTESLGAVPIYNMKGEQLCNAMMKAETKAKRRATLDLLGLGILDESEIAQLLPPNPLNGEQVLQDFQLLCDLENTTPSLEGWGGIPTSLFLGMKGLLKAVAGCATEKELLQLYNENKERIDNAPDLKQLFTSRKNQLRKKMAV